MKSRVNAIINQLELWKEARLEDSGKILDKAYRKEIWDQGLVETERFVDSVQHHIDGDTVYSGTDIDDPPYPKFLEWGWRHWRSNEIVGPYFPLTKAVAASEDELRQVWGKL